MIGFLTLSDPPPNVRKTVVSFSGKKGSVSVAMNEAGNPSVFTKTRQLKPLFLNYQLTLRQTFLSTVVQCHLLNSYYLQTTTCLRQQSPLRNEFGSKGLELSSSV